MKPSARYYIPRLTSVNVGESAVLDRQMEMFQSHVAKPVEEGSNHTTYANIFKNLHFGQKPDLETENTASLSSVIRAT